MSLIKYRTCTISGDNADAVLTFRESVADVVADVQSEIAQLNDLTADRRDDVLTLVNQDPATLSKQPIDPNTRLDTETISVYQNQLQQGKLYRQTPQYSVSLSGVHGAGGLTGTTEKSLGQWLFDEQSASSDALDKSFFNKTAFLTGTAPFLQEGPLSTSRSFSPGNYFTVPTGLSILELSESLMLNLGSCAAWAWVKVSDYTDENIILSFSAPPSTVLSVAATVTNASDTVTGVGFPVIAAKSRVAFANSRDIFEVVSATGTTIVLSSPFTGPSAVTTMYSATPFPPGLRNSAYGLSLTAGPSPKVRVWWQHMQRQTVEAFNDSFTLPIDEYFFVAFQRRFKPLTGTMEVGQGGGTFVYGTGTLFNSELAVGYWVNFVDFPDKWFQVVDVVNNTVMQINESLPFTINQTAKIVRTTVHVGLLDGTFNTEITDGLPAPSGGNEPVSSPTPTKFTQPNICNFYIGRDAERSSLGLTGALDAVSFFAPALDVSEDPAFLDSNVKFHYSRAFPDYVVSGRQVRRSVVSEIPSGATVFGVYKYRTGVNDSLATTAQLEAVVDGLIGGLGNPNAVSLSTLSTAIGTPDPSKTSDKDVLEESLARYGIICTNGQCVITGTVNIAPYNALVRTVGSANAANNLIAGKSSGSFILVAISEERHEELSIDACGNPTTTVVVTERVVGINRSLAESAITAGLTNIEALKLRLWWLGKVKNDSGTIAKMKALGLSVSQITNAIGLISDEQLTVYLIAQPEAGQILVDGGMDIDEIATRPDPPRLNIQPSPADVATAIQIAAVASPGATSDGDARPEDPALLISAVVSLPEALDTATAVNDFALAAAVEGIDQACTALAAILEDLIGNLERTFQQVSDALVPFAIHSHTSLGNQKLAFQKYIPCAGSVSASIGLPPYTFRLNTSISLYRIAEEAAQRVIEQAARIIQRFNTLLCIPRTLIAALRGGVCGIEQPKIIAERQCPSQLDLLLDRLQQLLDTIDLLLRRLLVAVTNLLIDIEISIGAASSLAVDISLPCIGPVADIVLSLG